MMKARNWLLAPTLVAALCIGQVVLSQAAQAQAVNAQEGDNDANTDQSGSSGSGDAIVGQVGGDVSGGDSTIDATNRSEKAKAATGDADADNQSHAFTGLTAGPAFTADTIIILTNVVNVQQGDNTTDVTQAADATTGDGVAGEVIGVVTSPGGSADLVLANTSLKSKVSTGDGDFLNENFSFTGHNATGLVLL